MALQRLRAFFFLFAFAILGCGVPTGTPQSHPTNETVPPTIAVPTEPCPVSITDKAALEVRRNIDEMQQDKEYAGKPLYLRVRVQGGGCSGFMNKLDLDPSKDDKIDSLYEVRGIQVVIDNRSKLYLQGSIVDYHNEPNKHGFSITKPSSTSE